MFGETYTLTFTECSENHVGMEKIGTKLPIGMGIKVSDLYEVYNFYKNTQYADKIELYNLNYKVEHEPAAILVIRGGVEMLGINSTSLFYEQQSLDKDKKFLNRGKVMNKIARWNLCFAYFDQEPDYENGKGRVISFERLPLTKQLKDNLHILLGSSITSHISTAEGNYYYNNKCGIGYHGDTERTKVIGIRLGDSMILSFRWYYQCNAVSENFNITLNHGDIYIMSEKATGTDFKKSSKYTLRHAAGASKYIN
jgi:hypothetical protein